MEAGPDQREAAMRATLYGLKNCDACRRAIKALGPAAVLVDVREDPPGAARLAAWYALFGDALVNRRSTTWQRLTGAERAKAESAEGAVALLAAHPALMKRPVVAAGGALHLGWGLEVRAALGLT